MLTEKQRELLSALRSGKYKKTTGVLRKGDCFCLEGVCCDLSGAGYWKGDSYYIKDDGEHIEFDTLAPGEVMEIFQMRNLITINDGNDLTFPEIADIIERDIQKYTYNLDND